MNHGAESDACEKYFGKRPGLPHIFTLSLFLTGCSLDGTGLYLNPVTQARKNLGILSEKQSLMNGGWRGLCLFHFFDHDVGEFRRARLAANILRQLLGMTVDSFQRIANLH